MRLRWAAFAAAFCLLCAPLSAQEARTLTLGEAFTRLLARHPDLARFQYSREGAQADLDEATQRPPLRVGLESENWPGTHAQAGTDEAQVTLSLASVLERGAKRDARRAVADAQMQALGLQEQARRLDLLAEVARRFLDLLADQALTQIADREVTQRERGAEAAAQRVRAGASPDSVRLTAEAAVARARLQRDRTQTEARAAARSLAALWNDRIPDFDRVTGDLLALPAVPPLDSLSALIERSPQLRQFADEKRLREARVQLARSARSADIEWQAGVRRLETTHEWTAVVGFSIPLGARTRAEPGVRAAEAELAALSLDRESQEITLYETLIDAHARLAATSLEVEMARTEVLPSLERAERAAEHAYRAGAASYLEWAQVQSERTASLREQIQASLNAHRALIEIQRLTGQPFIAAASLTPEETQP